MVSELNKKAWGGFIVFVVFLGLILFISAGTLSYWQGWVYLILFALSIFCITYYLMKNDPQLLSRRVDAGATAEKQNSQKIIQSIAQCAFLSVYIASALDHRFMLSYIPQYLIIVADICVVLGFFIVLLVFKENSFTSAVITVDKKQQVISTGPYAVVRHPMYSGALLLLLATPIALGSWWGLLTIIPMAFVIVWRLLDEEKYLLKELKGYPEYYKKVQWRLMPNII